MITYSTSAETVYNVSRQINRSLDLNEVLGKVLSLTVEAIGATKGSFLLLDDDGQVTHQILARPNQSPEVLQRNINLVMSKGLGGWVYRHQYGGLAADTNKDDRWVQLPDDTDITGSAIVVPLLYQERVNGLLALHHEQVRFFDESHLALAAGIAGQAAVAVENALLFTQVKEDREGLYALINAMPIPVLLVNEKGDLSFANETARQNLLIRQVDIPLEETKGGSRLKQALAKLQNGEDRHIEVYWPDERVFNVSVNRVPQLGTVVALDDITELKALDAMKTQFVETVSHDLKNPVGVIMGFVQLMQFEEGLSERAQKNLQGILQTAKNMQELIDDLLDLAKIEAGMVEDLEPCDLVEIVRDVLPNFELQIEEKQLNLSTELSDIPLMVMGDSLRLSQVATNYISNAVKYTPAGGKITVQAEQIGHDIKFRVWDTGPGISPASQSQLFQKFYRVPEVHTATGVSGTGLGLSIVKAIVESYGGRVWVKSQVGRGSTFGCALPSIENNE